MKNIGLYPRVQTDTAAAKIVSQAGAVSLVETVRAAGLDRVLSEALARWRKPLARHDPGKIVTDLALALAVGGDCLADVAVLRAEPSVFGPVASDPTVSRLVDTLAADADRALAAIDAARAVARARVWAAAGQHAPNYAADADSPVVIDVDATLVTSHSDKEWAAPTFKKGFGFHPLLVFADHGAGGTGEPLSVMLRKGNAGSNTAADHIEVLRRAFAQLPGYKPGRRPGRSVLVRADGAGGTHEFLSWLTGQRVQYSVGFTLPDTFTTE
ncbi:IS1380 family transposase, partial [Jatrophihabitans lederbergiae]